MGQLGAVIEAQPALTPTMPESGRDILEIGRSPRLLTTVLCEDIANSTADNTPVVYRIFLMTMADRLPHSQRLAAATFWLFDAPGTYSIEIRLLMPDGEVWVRAESEVVVENPGTYHTTSIHFGTLEFPTHGRYRIEVLLDGELAGAYPLFVQALPEAQGEV